MQQLVLRAIAKTITHKKYEILKQGCLDAEKLKEFKLVQKRQISLNVAKFKFALPTPTSVLGLPIGQHISCRFQHLLVMS
uniref:Flavoprotein pyridine nucleotide cytochrome reductase-like FAD-binding domain-containing protein n=1 Tax=Aegilops tauschii subsp. strangulata TaxID=200361 RepID=A0A453T1Y3_AEGTS